MARSHIRYTVTDRAGNVVEHVTCTFFLPGTSTPVSDIYAAATGGSPVGSAAFLTNGAGIVEAWVTAPQTVDVQVSDTSNTAYYPADSSVLLSFATFTVTLEAGPPAIEMTTSVAASTFAAHTSAIADDSATWDGYTVGQVVKSLRNFGLLA